MKCFSKIIIVFTAYICIISSCNANIHYCSDYISFTEWLEYFKKYAINKGIDNVVLNSVIPKLKYDNSVVESDRDQSMFEKSFLEFSDILISESRLTYGHKVMIKEVDILSSVERKYGVPHEVLVAFWGMESDFGRKLGKYNVLSSLATLAYDCRRSEYFLNELIHAIKLIQNGYIKIDEMMGGWAGELGPFMMLPSSYYQWGVDFDGDSTPNIISSFPDAIASAANFLVGIGWQRGEPWLQEVSVPTNMPWAEADLNIHHKVSHWKKLGVKPTHGVFVDESKLAALLLPMGRNGPAFLAYSNFYVYLKWNKSFIYSLTVAYYANLLSGEPYVYRGKGKITPLTIEEIKEMQILLYKKGLLHSDPDGKLGQQTRIAVKKAQIEYNLPADSYPDLQLLSIMRKRL